MGSNIRSQSHPLTYPCRLSSGGYPTISDLPGETPDGHAEPCSKLRSPAANDVLVKGFDRDALIVDQLDNNHQHGKLFTKLPRLIRVRTPVGGYSPDWAIVYDGNGTPPPYLAIKTKDARNLDWVEAMRNRFPSSHLSSVPKRAYDYNHMTDRAGLPIGPTSGIRERSGA